MSLYLTGGQYLREPSSAVLTGDPLASLAQHWPAPLPALPRLVYSPSFTHTQRISWSAHSWHASFESCVQCHIHINLNAAVKQFTSIYPVDVQPMITRQSVWRIIKWALSLYIMWYVYQTSCFLAILHPHVVSNKYDLFFLQDILKMFRVHCKKIVLFPAKISNNSQIKKDFLDK